MDSCIGFFVVDLIIIIIVVVGTHLFVKILLCYSRDNGPRFGPYLSSLVPLVLNHLSVSDNTSDDDDDDDQLMDQGQGNEELMELCLQVS